ncbi:MAG: hypothetical protein FWE78_03360 [Methanimicrococcus sp.]|nr:hypothetical protein [Methanimicrococcus sp.]
MTSNFCSNCGEPAAGPDANVCTNCGKPLHMTQTESVSNENYQNYENYQNANQNLVLAAVLSFVWPGLGQLYNGKFGKGILFTACYWIGLCILFIPGLIVWIYAMWDAYKEAEKINNGDVPFKTPSFATVAAFLFIPIIIFVLIYTAFIFLMMATMLAIPY